MVAADEDDRYMQMVSAEEPSRLMLVDAHDSIVVLFTKGFLD